MQTTPKVTVGDYLEIEFLEPLNLTQTDLAKLINEPQPNINRIIKGNRRINSEIDMKLCKLLNLTQGNFLRVQLSCDIREQKKQLNNDIEIKKDYDKITPLDV